MKFDKTFFARQEFTAKALSDLAASAERELEIAVSSPVAEVKFHFAYMALLKAGIYRIAREGYRVKSAPGHHKMIIETLSELLGDKEVAVVGDKMRRDRNLDLYAAGAVLSSAETDTHIKFIEGICKRVLGD